MEKNLVFYLIGTWVAGLLTGAVLAMPGKEDVRKQRFEFIEKRLDRLENRVDAIRP